MEAEGLGAELEDIMVQLEAKYGRRLQPGYNPSLRFMSHLWEPLRHKYRCVRVCWGCVFGWQLQWCAGVQAGSLRPAGRVCSAVPPCTCSW